MNIEKLAINREAFESVIAPLLPNNNAMYDALAKYTTDEFNGQYVDGDVQKAWVKFQALQSSEPVVWKYYYKDNRCKALSSQDENCICWHIEGTGNFKSARHDDENTMYEWKKFTHPPASVPLEKYNKVIDDIKKAQRWAGELECMLLNNARSKNAYEKMQMIAGFATDAINKAIAEAEGKEGWSL